MATTIVYGDYIGVMWYRVQGFKGFRAFRV